MNIVRRKPLKPVTGLQNVPAKIAQIYATRGIEHAGQLDNSLKALSHYQLLKGIEQAANMVANAITQQKSIMVIGDFDADGATSTALCMLSLNRLGSQKHQYLVPNRFDFGYGLSPEIVELAAQQGAQLIITVDSGINCIAGVERANALGIPVVITDHHLPGKQLPNAAAIVNPNQPDCTFPSKNLAGVGVAFYLMLAVKATLQQQGWFAQRVAPNLAEYLDIVALGTVADVVRLDANNRILVHQGLQRIRSGRCRPGIQAMLDIAGRPATKLAASDLGFVLGPRLNAAGRLDDMSVGIECLLCNDEFLAREMAAQLDGLNRERREIEAGMQQQALGLLDGINVDNEATSFAISLYQADWHQGVIGILAGRIKEKFHRPTVAFAHQDDVVIKGSVRSIPGLHVRDVLDDIHTHNPGLILKFGGHAMAAGLSIEARHFDKFSKLFNQTVARWLNQQLPQQTLLTDGELSEPELQLDFARHIKHAGPWGQGFDEPVFDGVFELISQRVVGEKHLKIQVRSAQGQALDGIAFNVDREQWPNALVREVHLVYKLDINEFRGRTSLQLIVDAIIAL